MINWISLKGLEALLSGATREDRPWPPIPIKGTYNLGKKLIPRSLGKYANKQHSNHPQRRVHRAECYHLSQASKRLMREMGEAKGKEWCLSSSVLSTRMASQPQNASYLRGASDKGPVLEPISIVAIWRSSIQEDFYGRNPMWRQERFLSIYTRNPCSKIPTFFKSF